MATATERRAIATASKAIFTYGLDVVNSKHSCFITTPTFLIDGDEIDRWA